MYRFPADKNINKLVINKPKLKIILLSIIILLKISYVTFKIVHFYLYYPTLSPLFLHNQHLNYQNLLLTFRHTDANIKEFPD